MVEFSRKLEFIPEYVPGKSIENISEKWGIAPEKIVKLASNENPLGPPNKVVKFLKKQANKVNLYPDRIGISLLKKISEKYRIDTENVFIGNGSSEIVDMLCRIMLNPGNRGITFEKEFALYKTCIKASDGELVEAETGKNFKRNTDSLLPLAKKNAKIVFIANPNNPTGDFIEKKELIKLINAIDKNALIVIDEAYIEYLGEEHSLIDFFLSEKRENLVILRTFSKIYGLAGLRVGYCFASKKVISALRRIKLPVNVPYLSQKGCQIALECDKFRENSKKHVETEKERIFKNLKQNGIDFLECKGNFYLVKDEKAKETVEKLESKGIVVRSLAPYGINDYFRITVGTKEQNDLFLKKLKKIK